MKTALIVLLVSVGCAFAFVPPSPGPYGPSPCGACEEKTPERLFDDFKRTFGRRYSPSEESEKLACFQENLALIEKRNAQDPTAMHGVNQFADICPAEFAKMYLGYRPSNGTRKGEEAAPMVTKSCSSIDWRAAGIVTPVKNQGQCGSCWSFSATGNMEGQWAKAKGQLVSLSEEELVQCSSSAGGDQGCDGGLMDDAFAWVIQNGGITSEANYPYTSGFGTTGTCQSTKLTSKVATFSSYKNIPANEKSMAAWVCENGPLSIAVDALSWQTYMGGVVTNCGGTQLDHGVLIVGFNEVANPPYWIIKNSWGASWGEQGYIRVEMFKDECGLNEAASSIAV